MSGPDETDRGFLSRWSQRKQEARQPEPDAPGGESVASSESPAPQDNDVAPEFDLSTLPNLEELTGCSDMTAFLRKGVPEHLRNAALRKSWALDPAIRNYVNPALEYAYDWNAPGGVPGGGELGSGIDVARLVSQIMGEPAAEMVNSASNSKDDAAISPAEPPERNLLAESQADLPEQSLRRSNARMTAETEVVSKGNDDNGQPASIEESLSVRPAAPQHPLRRHGTAKPTV
jgi:hypothetical protein